MKIKNLFRFVLPQVRPNRSLRILIAANTLMNFTIGIFAPFYAVFVENIGGTIAFAGLSWALFSVVAGLLTLLFRRWQLRVKEQELLLALGYIIRGTVFLSYAFMGGIVQLLLTQVLWGIASALGTPAFDAVYSAHTRQKDSIVQWGQWEGISAIATGLAAIVGGVLFQFIGYSPVFVGMSLLSFVLGIYIWWLPRKLL